jgi:hypothetical protein
MFEFLKSIFKHHRGAISAIALLHVFTFIPAATVFWFEQEPKFHVVYYAFAASVATLTSWVLSWVTRDIRYSIKHYFVKTEIMLAVMAILAAPFLLTFYLGTAVYFANFFEQVYPANYLGPNRAISAIVIFVFYNLFFYKDLISIIKNRKRNIPIGVEKKI